MGRRERRAQNRPAEADGAEEADSDGEAEMSAEREEGAERGADRQARSFREEWKSAPASQPNPDGFVPKRRNLPRDHALATDHAEERLLDSARTLLDLHYEARLRDAEVQRLRKKAEERPRTGEGEEDDMADMAVLHAEAMPAKQQCEEGARLQAQYPWVQAGTDYFDGSHGVC